MTDTTHSGSSQQQSSEQSAGHSDPSAGGHGTESLASPNPSPSHEEVPHVHEEVKDVDELIAAMDHVEEGMAEEEDEAVEGGKQEKEAESTEKTREPVASKESEELRHAKERLSHIKSKMLTLQWDLEHGQINPAKKAQFERLKPELEALVKKVAEAGAVQSSNQ